MPEDREDRASDPPVPAFDSDEILRIMDAAQVVRARKQRLEVHEEFDREAAVREIQVIYEGIGDLVERDVIERALDEYLAERHAFRPPPPGPARTLARLYVRRGAVTRRVILPAAVVAALVWGGLEVAERSEAREARRAAAAVLADYETLGRSHADARASIDALRASAGFAALPPAEAAEAEASLGTAESRLEALEALVWPAGRAAGPGPGEVGPGALEAERSRLAGAHAVLGDVRGAIEVATGLVTRQDRLERARTRLGGLAAAIASLAEEPEARERAARLETAGRRFAEARDAERLEATVETLETLEERLAREYRIVITGGVWRYRNDDPSVRNYYVVVETVDTNGDPVPVDIVNEETGRTETVSEWAERVPRDVYDRVRLDREDNGIIDDDAFGSKRRGILAVDRVYPDVGQITDW